MSASVNQSTTFQLDGVEIDAYAGETILAGGETPCHRYSPSVLFRRAGLPGGRKLPGVHGGDRGRARSRRELHPHARRRG